MAKAAKAMIFMDNIFNSRFDTRNFVLQPHGSTMDFSSHNSVLHAGPVELEVDGQPSSASSSSSSADATPTSPLNARARITDGSVLRDQALERCLEYLKNEGAGAGKDFRYLLEASREWHRFAEGRQAVGLAAQSGEPGFDPGRMKAFGTRLHYAAMDGSIAGIQYCLGVGVPINQLNQQGRSALGVAVHRRRGTAAQILLDAAADVMAAGSPQLQPFSAFHAQCRECFDNFGESLAPPAQIAVLLASKVPVGPLTDASAACWAVGGELSTDVSLARISAFVDHREPRLQFIVGCALLGGRHDFVDKIIAACGWEVGTGYFVLAETSAAGALFVLAAASGSVPTMKWLETQIGYRVARSRIPADPRIRRGMLCQAAAGGHVEMLKYLYSVGCVAEDPERHASASEIRARLDAATELLGQLEQAGNKGLQSVAAILQRASAVGIHAIFDAGSDAYKLLSLYDEASSLSWNQPGVHLQGQGRDGGGAGAARDAAGAGAGAGSSSSSSSSSAHRSGSDARPISLYTVQQSVWSILPDWFCRWRMNQGRSEVEEAEQPLASPRAHPPRIPAADAAAAAGIDNDNVVPIYNADGNAAGGGGELGRRGGGGRAAGDGGGAPDDRADEDADDAFLLALLDQMQDREAFEDALRLRHRHRILYNRPRYQEPAPAPAPAAAADQAGAAAHGRGSGPAVCASSSSAAAASSASVSAAPFSASATPAPTSALAAAIHLSASSSSAAASSSSAAASSSYAAFAARLTSQRSNDGFQHFNIDLFGGAGGASGAGENGDAEMNDVVEDEDPSGDDMMPQPRSFNDLDDDQMGVVAPDGPWATALAAASAAAAAVVAAFGGGGAGDGGPAGRPAQRRPGDAAGAGRAARRAAAARMRNEPAAVAGADARSWEPRAQPAPGRGMPWEGGRDAFLQRMDRNGGVIGQPPAPPAAPAAARRNVDDLDLADHRRAAGQQRERARPRHRHVAAAGGGADGDSDDAGDADRGAGYGGDGRPALDNELLHLLAGLDDFVPAIMARNGGGPRRPGFGVPRMGGAAGGDEYAADIDNAAGGAAGGLGGDLPIMQLHPMEVAGQSLFTCPFRVRGGGCPMAYTADFAEMVRHGVRSHGVRFTAMRGPPFEAAVAAPRAPAAGGAEMGAALVRAAQQAPALAAVPGVMPAAGDGRGYRDLVASVRRGLQADSEPAPPLYAFMQRLSLAPGDPCGFAAATGQIEVLEWLTDYDRDGRQRCQPTVKSLQMALLHAQLEAAQWILDQGLGVHQSLYPHLVEAAASSGNVDVLEWACVIKRWGRLGLSFSALLAGVKSGNLRVVIYLHECGWNVTTLSTDRQCLLYAAACQAGHIHVLDWLYQRFRDACAVRRTMLEEQSAALDRQQMPLLMSEFNDPIHLLAMYARVHEPVMRTEEVNEVSRSVFNASVVQGLAALLARALRSPPLPPSFTAWITNVQREMEAFYEQVPRQDLIGPAERPAGLHEDVDGAGAAGERLRGARFGRGARVARDQADAVGRHVHMPPAAFDRFMALLGPGAAAARPAAAVAPAAAGAPAGDEDDILMATDF